MLSRAKKLATLIFLLLVYSSAQAESSVKAIFELGITRAIFDDQVVAGNSSNLEVALAVSYKSIIEFGYTSIIDLANASMDTQSGIRSKDGFYASGEMYYLRGLIPLTSSVDIFALAGRSKFTVEATSTTGCFFFCGDVFTTTSESNYLHEESGVALGIGMGFTTIENRQLIIQYVDYNYGGRFDFKVFTLSYRWLLDFPA
ncbi:MAG: hypothetical protein ACI9LO_000927 [Planctomycetota bacterium]|jgi:hypothetical protein